MTSERKFKTFSLLPPAPDKCLECASEHPLEHPHNRDSLFYQIKFRQEHGRDPTWNDAMRHCTEEMQRTWRKALWEIGIDVPEEVQAP